MIEFHQYPGSWQLPSSSPFCIKVETYMRMAKIPYTTVWENNPNRGPKGKMPFIKDKGKIIADSSFIVEYLQSEYPNNLDEKLAASDRGIMLAFQRLIEESLYWVLLYSRWGDGGGWCEIKKEITPLLPPLIGGFILRIIRKRLLKQGYYQGTTRHSRDEIYHIAKKDISATANFLGNKPFFLGKKPRSIDASLYGFLITILDSPVPGPLPECTRKHQNLQDYCLRIKKRYWE